MSFRTKDSGSTPQRKSSADRRPAGRQPRFEVLEERRLLAITVDTLSDVVGNDGLTSLREAIEAANNSPGADVIAFAASLSGGTINLLSELSITGAVTIDTAGLAGRLRIDAGDGFDHIPGTFDGFRIFNIDDGDIGNQVDVEIRGMQIIRGDTSGGGGAIFNRENLTITGTTIWGNWAGNSGGGIFNDAQGKLTVASSTLSGNATLFGGGIYNLGTANVTNSTFDSNNASGGGIFNRENLTVTNSTLSGNSGTFGGGITNYGVATITRSFISGGSSYRAGGIQNNGSLSVTDSTVSGNISYYVGGIGNHGHAVITNSTVSNNDGGFHAGGIHNEGTGNLWIINSTIAGNSAAYGAGITNGNQLTITNSTITGNTASQGGGILNGSTATLNNTLVAGNSADTSPDVHYSISGTHNLIGDGTGMTGLVNGIDGNQVGTNEEPIDPLLGPLANNGGPTWTHALLPGSPAIDAGDPEFMPPPDFDQRGAPYSRVAGGRIDIGAFEVQTPATVSGDFDGDGDVDGRDFLFWQRGGSPVPLSSGDLDAWRQRYGNSELLVVSGELLESRESSVESQEPDNSGSRLWTLSSGLNRETAHHGESETSDVEAVFENSYVEQVDRALEQLALPGKPTVASFGEMVARRGLKRAVVSE